ncbi:SUN domain-containing protein 3-like [Nymphaea colorata]|nr:SUN domain-containing protein 3-like [Nymphaea colorata]
MRRGGRKASNNGNGIFRTSTVTIVLFSIILCSRKVSSSDGYQDASTNEGANIPLDGNGTETSIIEYDSIADGYSVEKGAHDICADYLIKEYDFIPDLEDLGWCDIGDFGGEVEDKKNLEGDRLDEVKKADRSSRASYLGLNEFRKKTIGEKGKGVNNLGNITHRLEPGGGEYNYAAASKGAKVLAHNKEANGAANILGKDKDKYLRNPCSAEEKFVVIELSEETLVDVVEIANFEHYSSTFKEFELLGSLIYPTEIWVSLGKYIAANSKHAQRFMLSEPKWVRYLKLNLLSHYGSEFYCTLSSVKVYGVDAVERLLEDLIPVPEESSGPVSTANPAEIPHKANEGEIVQVLNGSDHPSKVHNVQPKADNISKTDAPNDKNDVSKDAIPDPVKEIRQQPSGRIPSDTVLKILMQKVRSLELNLSVLEDYLQEVNRRYSKLLPDLDKELSQTALLLEQTRLEIKDVVEWKEMMNKSIGSLLTWKSVVSSQMNTLIGDNNFLRMEMQKLLTDQRSLENKELTVLVLSFILGCLAFLKLVSDQTSMIISTRESQKICRTSRAWLILLISNCIIVFIVLL